MRHLFAINNRAVRAGSIWAVGLFGMISMPAMAHVTLEYQVANAGSSYKATFRVGHGCDGAPVKQIIVMIPEGVQGAKPMPKAGWTLAIARDKLAKPRQDHGQPVTEDVSRITWTAQSPENYLQDGWYDEFVLQAKLPSEAGNLYWPVSQVCESGRVDWNETPKPGQKLMDLKYPAAQLELMPAAAGGHSH